MDMVVHQSVAPKLKYPSISQASAHQAEINETIGVVSKDVLFSIASVNHMMRTTWYNNAWESQWRDPSLRKGQASKNYRRTQVESTEQLTVAIELGDLGNCPRIT